jgi:hypothetical protein
MQATLQHRPNAGMTVIELLVSVAVMTVIVYGLYTMFSHTQKALRSNITQVDVFESGRAAMEMIGRELQELSASKLADTVNIQATLIPRAVAEPLIQTELDETRPLRTNVLEDLFFLSSFTNKWTATGYRVMEPEHGIGTLYRFSHSTNVHFIGTNALWNLFSLTGIDPATKTVSTNLHRVADGVIHFRVSTYDQLGRPFELDYQQLHLRTNRDVAFLNAGRTFARGATNTIFLRPDSARAHVTEFFFTSRALPSYVEVELGVLEPETFKQYQSMKDNAVLARKFLQKRANKVHLFRQRVPIRTAVP